MTETASTPKARPRVVAGLRLLRPVGRGGEGEVWEARDPEGRSRALKLLRPEILAPPAELSRRGAHLLRIDHANLVRVHRTGRLAGSSLDGWGFLEMDFVDGQPLSEVPADPDIVERLAPLAEALDDLHRGLWSDGVPLVHRDVKPANLIETPQGTIVLVDCSTLRGADATHLTRVGTPVFSAPEVMTGRIGPAADVYSFAVTVIALVTGARGDDLAGLVEGSRTGAGWTLNLPHAVGRALSERPEDRPLSCEAVLESGSTITIHDLDDLGGAEDGDQVEGGWEEQTSPSWAQTPAAVGGGWPAASNWQGAEEWEPGPAWPWLLVLGAVIGLVVVGLIGGTGVPPAGLLGGAAVLHLGAHLAADRPLLAALFVPPAAWAFLLASRVLPPGQGRAWTAAAATGALTIPPVAATWLVMAPQGPAVEFAAPIAAGAALVASTAAVHVPESSGGLVLRLVLLPVWLLGAVLVILGCVVALPVALLVGRGGTVLRLGARTLGSAAAFFRV